jgi:putative ABC transport system permease protein
MLVFLIRHILRSIKSQGLYALINILCLFAGLLAFFLCMLYVRYESSFDTFNTKRDRIYRLTTARDGKAGAIVPYIWGSVLKEQWSEVDDLATIQNITIALSVKLGDEVYAQHGVVGADSTFFNIFEFPVIEGKRVQFLRTPNKIVITSGAAEKYFGNEDPIGKSIQINLWGNYVDYQVEGVVECPSNSHLQFEFLIPIHFVKKNFFSPTAFDSWTTRFAYTYILLKNAEAYKNHRDEVRKYLKDFLERNGGKDVSDRFDPDIQPLEDIYLESAIAFDFQPRNSITHVKILILAGLSILLMSIINFTNLTSAQYLNRLREIGLKKILGASRSYLIVQLLIESVLVSLISLVLVCLLIPVLLPFFNGLTGRTFTPSAIFNARTALLWVAITITVGVISGIYPAIAISALRPITILGSRIRTTLATGNALKYLVIAQFVAATLLLVSTGVVHRQVGYMQNKDLGFNKNQVIVMQDVREVASNPVKSELFRNEITKFGSIEAVSASSSSPGQITWAAGYQPDGFADNERISISTIYADCDFVDTYGLTIKEGRNFDKQMISDSTALLINEAAIELFSTKDASWSENPLNRKISSPDIEGNVVGVLRDFHIESLEQQIVPLIIQIDPENFFNIQMKIKAEENMASSLRLIESTWKKLFPDLPFTYAFVDQEFSKLFASDQKLSSILSVFTVISICIAILGLFGLASFQSFEKAKEMSIRKVVGETGIQLLILQTWRFTRLILAANLIAMPLGFTLMQVWLNTFAYRINFPLSIFFISFAITLVVTMLTTLYHATRASRVNPVDILSR